MDGKTKGDSSPHHSDVGRGALALSLTVLLIQACASGDVAKVADLVSEKNIDPFAGDESGRTPLAVACETGHMEVVKFLMERDKEGRALKGAGGTTPLHVAARGGHIEVVKYLIDDRGMDPSCEDSDGFTPLDCAQNNKMRKCLLSRGARGSKTHRFRRHKATESPSIPRPLNPVSLSFLSPSASAASLEVVVCMFEFMKGALIIFIQSPACGGGMVREPGKGSSVSGVSASPSSHTFQPTSQQIMSGRKLYTFYLMFYHDQLSICSSVFVLSLEGPSIALVFEFLAHLKFSDLLAYRV